MTLMIMRRTTILFLLLILSTALPALAKEEQIYTIKKGDTLWGLSQRFIDDPYYWPNMWANNPDITNPHLIFPGQKIRVKDGRLEIIPAYPEAQAAAEEPAVAPEEPVEETVQIQSAGGGDGFILTEEQPLGILVDSVDNRVLLTKDDLVFLKMADIDSVKVGDTYSLFRRGEQIKHPLSNETVGTKMYDLGYLQVTEIIGETVAAKIGTTYREITRGAELFEYIPPHEEISLQRGKAELGGLIIAAREEKLTQATNDVVFIDLGSEHGLTSGNLLYISRPREVSKEILKQAGKVDLPDEVLGAAVVIDARQKSASAIIIKSVGAMFIGDKVTVVNN